MSKKRDPFDFWYAVNKTRIVLLPANPLETFGSTVLKYHHISELMDTVGMVRIREGTMRAHPPEIVTPEAYAKLVLEGFGEEARRYIEWIKENEKNLRILKYGYVLSQQPSNEEIVTGKTEEIAMRVRDRVLGSNASTSAVVIGVDDAWDVSLIKLFVEIVRFSVPHNIKSVELKRIQDIEEEFAIVAKDKDKKRLYELGRKLQEYNLFEEYEDRFFALVKLIGM